MATEADAAQRTSAGSGRSSGSRRQNVGRDLVGIVMYSLTLGLQPQQQLSQIEKSVTHLLVATKQLLETLTQWSRGTATEGEVSDVYVRLGYEFNIACRAFNAIGVDTQDLGPVPDLLRTILEDTLSQEASQASLDRFLPRIRDIIINLLQGLKKKQSRLRARTAKDMERSGSSASREDSLTSAVIDGQEIPARTTSGKATRQGSRDLPTELPPRTSSRNEGRSSPAYHDTPGQRVNRFDSQGTMHSSSSSMSSTTAQNMPVMPPYPQEDTIPTQASAPQPPPHANGQAFPPPPPPPKQQDALLALQRGGDLERRASRRFSTYQIKQQLGGGANGIPMIPPTQNTPIPNRGREVRESIQAVRQRGSQTYNRQKSERRLVGEESPNRKLPTRISEENVGKPPVDPRLADETMVKTPEDKLAQPSYPIPDINEPGVSATVSGPVDELFISESPAVPAAIPARRSSKKEPAALPEHFVPEESPQPGKPLTLFLQYKSKVKKFVLDDSSDLSIARIQLAFIDKFAWNTHGDGVDLPEIYIQDSVSGVRYELEDLSDIKNNAVLVLNVEALDEVKRHIDDGLGQLRRVVEGIRTAVEDQQSALQKVNDRQQETAKEIAGIAAAPRLSAPPASSAARSLSPMKATPEQFSELQSIRRNLAVMRQTYSSFVSEIEGSMAAIRTKAASVKSVAVKVALPDLKGESGRAYVNQGLEAMSKEQENLVERVEEVQDSVEDLRKDVVMRGVRPLPRQLEQVAKDISNATTEVKRMESNLTKEKPMFNKIWKAELQQVCDDRDNIAEAEALIQDFKVDLESAEKTFRLVEEATKQQNLVASQSPPGSGNLIAPRSLSGSKMMAAFGIDQAVDPRKAKDNVLIEVQGLKIDHEDRMEAIERAEKARQKELENRKEGAFKKELGNFVDEGKLKKTGGVEEAERLRKAKDERVRREVWERQNTKAQDENTPPGTDSADAVDKPEGLVVPRAGEKADGSSSPEPEFVEAKEQQPHDG